MVSIWLNIQFQAHSCTSNGNSVVQWPCRSYQAVRIFDIVFKAIALRICLYQHSIFWVNLFAYEVRLIHSHLACLISMAWKVNLHNFCPIIAYTTQRNHSHKAYMETLFKYSNSLQTCTIIPSTLNLFVFSRQGFSVQPWLSWNHLPLPLD